MSEKNLSQESMNAASPSTFPTAGDLLAMLGFYFVVMAAVMFLAVVALLFTGRGITDLTPEGQGVLTATTSFVVLTVTAGGYLWYRKHRGGGRLRIPFRVRNIQLPLMGWALLTIFATGIVLEPLFELLPPVNQEVGSGFWTVVALVVIAPLFEEYICRGILFGSLRQRYGTTRAVLLSALFFGVLHLQPVAVINAFVIGVVLAMVYAITRTLWSSILLHACNNLIAYLLIRSGVSESQFSELLSDYPTLYKCIYAVAVVALVGSLIALWQIARRARSTDNEPTQQPASE